MIEKNTDQENYFVVAVQPYNIIVDNVSVFEVFRGQYFKWSSKIVPSLSQQCRTCEKVNGSYNIYAYASCKDQFTDDKGNLTKYNIPDYVFEETYDVDDDDGICESWFHEIGGTNKDIFTPPHYREEYKDWNAEKSFRQ